ncbi:hypothetical protein MiAbW_01457 [Microcystis aeruginosa NIES-4325]|uniref:Uncharacterized protein n=1 Tax=Microcystis aeruginosa NIES-4325 TaxID=2569534 RepID=A0A5J4F755_MICAE|nr:hypothetical protein MiAbW_01457 [Microcystis aeruginosa NIES-4325]
MTPVRARDFQFLRRPNLPGGNQQAIGAVIENNP